VTAREAQLGVVPTPPAVLSKWQHVEGHKWNGGMTNRELMLVRLGSRSGRCAESLLGPDRAAWEMRAANTKAATRRLVLLASRRASSMLFCFGFEVIPIKPPIPTTNENPRRESISVA
jgi:hypothetical protein